MFHAGEDYGGLGVPQLRVTIPMLREARITRPMSSDDPDVLAMTMTWHFKTVLREMERARPAIGGVTLSNKMEAITLQADALHATQDGKGLSNTRKCAGHSVLTNGTVLMTGSTSIDVTKIRGNLMSTKGRIQRWHSGQDASCEACGRRETLGHILQVCPRSWGVRIKRHDKVVDLTETLLKRKGFSSPKEPIIKTRAGMKKPDLAIWKEGKAWDLDGLVCSDNADLDAQFQDKVQKYELPEVTEDIKERTDVDSVTYGAIMLNWRGALAPKTSCLLRELGLRSWDLQLLIARTLEGSSRT